MNKYKFIGVFLMGIALFFATTIYGQDGPFKLYYENGRVQEEGTYKGGKKEGLFKTYYENGLPKQELTYKNGKLDGPYKAYSKNGQITMEGTNLETLNRLAKMYGVGVEDLIK